MNRGYIVFVPAVWHGYAASMCRYTEAEAVERFDSFVAGPMPLAMAESVARELNAIVLMRESTKYRAEYIARREVRAEKLRRASAYLVSAGEEIAL